MFTLLATWKRGRALLSERLTALAIAIEPFLDSIARHPPARVPGTAVFLTTKFEGVPHALLHNLKHNKVLHERVVLLTVVFQDIPHIDNSERIEIWPLGNDFYKVFVIYGFKDETNIPQALELCAPLGLEFNMMDTSFFLSRETLIPTKRAGHGAVARKAVRQHGAQRRQRHRLLPDSDQPRGRARHAGRVVAKAGVQGLFSMKIIGDDDPAINGHHFSVST